MTKFLFEEREKINNKTGSYEKKLPFTIYYYKILDSLDSLDSLDKIMFNRVNKA